MKSIFLITFLFCQIAIAGNTLTVRLPKARPYNPSCEKPLSAKRQGSSLACLAERAKYKCTTLGKTLKGIGSYYGKGDKFTGGATLCEKPFFPNTDKILALQDSLISRKIFTKGLCGRKAVVVSYEPDTGRCTSTEVEVSDTGNLGANDFDNKNSTRDILKKDKARAGVTKSGANREIAANRMFDLSYAAARALRYADDKKTDDGVDDGKAYMEVTICQESAPARLTPGATKELRNRDN